MEKLKIIFMGTPEFGLKALENLYNTHDVIAVVCQPDKPSNRGEIKFSKIKLLLYNTKFFSNCKGKFWFLKK